MSNLSIKKRNAYSRFRTTPKSLQKIDITDMNLESPLKILSNPHGIVSPKAKLQSIVLLLFLSSVTVFSAPADGPATTLWQIGQFDESSEEFASRSTNQTIRYEVGQSDPAKDWVRVHVGSGDGSAHPYSIDFALSQEPRGHYRLKIALLAISQKVPWLEVNVNDHRGWFYLHPRLTYARGAGGFAQSTTISSDTLLIDVPPAFLKKGQNELILTAISDPAPEPEDKTPRPYRYGSAVLGYDAIALVHDQKSSSKGGLFSVKAVPTIYYQAHGSGLAELVNIYLSSEKLRARNSLTLRVGGNAMTQSADCDRDFGEQRFTFSVPEFASTQPAEVTIRSGARQQRVMTKITPVRKWRIAVIPHTHLDIGYIDRQEKVAEIHARTIDDVMVAAKKHPTFQFTLDGYWQAEQFLSGRSEDWNQEFYQMVKDRRIHVPAQYASLMTGTGSLETLIRSFYFSHALHARHGGSRYYANSTDEPSYTWSYASILAAAGMKYFISGSNNFRAPILYFGRLHEKSPFWWEGPDGQKVLMWYSRIYTQLQEVFGFPPRISLGEDGLPLFLQNYDRLDYKPDTVIMYGTQGDNIGFFPEQISVVDAWNKKYVYPKLEFMGFEEAMDRIAKQAGDSIPTVRGDGAPYWEDGAGSDAIMTAVNRSNEQRVITAEKLATITSLLNSTVQFDPEHFKQIWRRILLFEEHTWGATGTAEPPEDQQHLKQHATKQAYALDAQRLTDELLLRSQSALGANIPGNAGTFVVFNALNWPRSGLVQIDLPKGQEIPLATGSVDLGPPKGQGLRDVASGKNVPFEVLYSANSYRRVRFMAQDVPAMGYRCYTLGTTETEIPQNVAESTTLESAAYRIVLDPASGSIRSIIDKELNRELVNTKSPYRFGQYLYVTSKDQEPTRLTKQFSLMAPMPEFVIHAAENGRLKSVQKTPFGTVVRMENSGVNTPKIETEIILFDREKKIELIQRVQKTQVYTREGVYFAFPFAIEHPVFRYAVQNGNVNPKKDLLPGAGQEWFTAHQWVSVEGDGLFATIVPVDAPLVTFGDIVRGTWATQFGERPANVFSYAMNNYWPGNFPYSQGGEFTFRYVLTSERKPNSGRPARLGWEAMTPLEIEEITPFDRASTNSPPALDPGQGSFLTVDQPNVVVTAWKRAENGRGTILRLLEIEGKPSTVRITLPRFAITSAAMCNALEDDQLPISTSGDGLQIDIKPNQIVTLRIERTSAKP